MSVRVPEWGQAVGSSQSVELHAGQRLLEAPRLACRATPLAIR